MKNKLKLTILLGILLFFISLGIYLFFQPIHVPVQLTVPYEVTMQRGSATIIAYLSDEKEIYIPDKILGVNVTYIDDNAFEHLGTDAVILNVPKSILAARNLYDFRSHSYYTIWYEYLYLNKYMKDDQKIEIPDSIWGRSVTNISFQCFENRDMDEITIPDTVVYIGGGAFSNCKNLKQITLPSNLEKIAPYAFEYSGIEKIYLPETIKEIGEGAFSYSGLKEITGLEHIAYIGNYAFRGTPLEESIEGDFVCISNALHLYRGLETEVVLPSTITSINGGFYIDENYPYPINVTKVFIPESVTSISPESFYGQKGTEIYIPPNVTVIGCDSTDTPLKYADCIFADRLDGIIITTEGSAAEAYAIAQRIPYKIITEEEMQREMEKAINKQNNYS